MKGKTQCIVSIVLTVLLHILPVLPIGYLLPITEYSVFFVYPCCGIAAAVIAYGMDCFSDGDFSERQEKLLLGFPMTAGVLGVLNCIIMIFGRKLAAAVADPLPVYFVISIGEALALTGWLIYNIRLLIYLRRDKQ